MVDAESIGNRCGLVVFSLVELVAAYGTYILISELGNMERPFILFDEGKPVCAYFAVSDGKDGLGFANCTRTWNMPIKLKEGF